MTFWGAGSTKAIQALIEEVRKRPVLWNPKHALYHHRTLISDQWDEIADNLGTSTMLVKTKWKGLRDNFRKEVKKLIKLDKDISPWIHMKHLNFLWTVLDTSQLECDKERLQLLKDRHNAPKLTEEDTYIISHVRKIEDDGYFHSLEENSQDGNSSNSMDFHDYIFGHSDEVPVETFLVTDENDEVVIIHDDEMEEDLTPQIQQSSPPPLRILDTKRPQNHRTYPPKLKVLQKARKQTLQPLYMDGGAKRFAIQSYTDMDDSDMHFLKSILPFLAQLSPRARKRTHAQIKRIIMQEFNEVDQEQPKLNNVDPSTIPELHDEIQIKDEPIDLDYGEEKLNDNFNQSPFITEIKEEIELKIEPESIEC